MKRLAILAFIALTGCATVTRIEGEVQSTLSFTDYRPYVKDGLAITVSDQPVDAIVLGEMYVNVKPKMSVTYKRKANGEPGTFISSVPCIMTDNELLAIFAENVEVIPGADGVLNLSFSERIQDPLAMRTGYVYQVYGTIISHDVSSLEAAPERPKVTGNSYVSPELIQKGSASNRVKAPTYESITLLDGTVMEVDTNSSIVPQIKQAAEAIARDFRGSPTRNQKNKCRENFDIILDWYSFCGITDPTLEELLSNLSIIIAK